MHHFDLLYVSDRTTCDPGSSLLTSVMLSLLASSYLVSWSCAKFHASRRRCRTSVDERKGLVKSVYSLMYFCAAWTRDCTFGATLPKLCDRIAEFLGFSTISTSDAFSSSSPSVLSSSSFTTCSCISSIRLVIALPISIAGPTLPFRVCPWTLIFLDPSSSHSSAPSSALRFLPNVLLDFPVIGVFGGVSSVSDPATSKLVVVASLLGLGCLREAMADDLTAPALLCHAMLIHRVQRGVKGTREV